MCISFFFSCKQVKKDIAETRNEFASVSNETLNRVEPPNWWIGMKTNKLQLLVHHDAISDYTPSVSYNGVTIEKVTKATKSPNYLFIDFSLAENLKAGAFDIVFKNEKGDEKRHTYTLKNRTIKAENYIGFNSADAVYLITPDRFANGNSDNDINENLLETTIDRNKDYTRHGGDIQGLIKHLDYISDLGFTAIWSSPLLTNNMTQWSYHGYAITDYYQVDPRFGTLQEYKDLSNIAKLKGLKLIMDQVANHCGLNHWWMQDLPFEDWVNYQKHFEDNRNNWDWKTVKHSNHRRTTNQDLYASKIDKMGNSNGWFVDAMPDLNQRNPFMAKYIIQNSIWWIETLKLAGIRQDTYPYPDKNFMSDWAGAIMNEYPNFNIVGEEWSYNPLLIGYWQEGQQNRDGYSSNLKSTMDFAMHKAIIDALNEEEAWDKGLIKLYEGLANDFTYASPKDLMVFPDNHDMSRIFTQLKGDIVNTKIALSHVLVLPRIPQIYYGTEILMDDSDKPGDHGLIRSDFPGGWQDDKINAFTGKGLSAQQKDMQGYLKKILNYRKTSKAIHEGKTTHFAPIDGVYVLFRERHEETVVHIINKNSVPITIDLDRFSEIGLQGKTLKNIITEKIFAWENEMSLLEKSSVLLTTKL